MGPANVVVGLSLRYVKSSMSMKAQWMSAHADAANVSTRSRWRRLGSPISSAGWSWRPLPEAAPVSSADEGLAPGGVQHGIDPLAVSLGQDGVLLAQPVQALALIGERCLSVGLAVDLDDHLVDATL